ncbi:MAG: gliding motility-associated C-terminal domain-containing protein, partial [Cytophagales bacterium]|nr:gliding motility-associated C-terminal domain-containing protein [Cytophagales bacterium]
DRGIWGLSESKPFYVNQSSTIIQNNIVAMEYFIDADPGRGLGVAIPITPAINLNILENVPTSPLAEGFHLITVRAQDDRGIWGLSESKPFYVNLSSGAMQNNLINLEYFFDVDPSVGSGITVPLTPAGNINMLQSIATGSLSDGLHVIFIRAQDENNLWGQAESKAFFIDDSRLIVNYEYAIDVDPGIGLAIQQLIVPPQSAIDEPLSIDTNPLAIGGHSLFIRVKDSNLFWSKTNTVTFIVCSGAAANFSVAADCQGNPTTFADLSTNVLVGDAYGWDFDGDGTIDDMTAGNTSYVYAVTGSYLAMLTIDRSGCTSSFTTNVNIVNSATAFTGPDFTICEGSIASLSGSFGGSATSASWSTSGSGTFDDPTSLTAIYAPGPSDAGAGLIPITLTTDDPPGGCVAGISTMNLTVTQRPTANAGSDRPVCPASTLTLSGIIGGTATSSTWMTSGDGLFNNAALLNATYSAGPNDAVSGTFDLTLITDDPDGAGPCTFATSQITVTISQPVSAAPLTTNARVQQVVNLDVISPAAISPGDVVTVNIQQAGAKGLTSIKPDLSIDYIPNPGTVGADLIDFQLCNQCSLCDTERIAITILNEPPVVVVPASPILTQTGTMIQIDLLPLISDLNDNIDFNSIAIVVAPVSQAVAFIDAALTLTVDYSSNQFTGLDNLTIEVCDLMGACVRQVLTIQVEGDLIVHNAISPNGDGLNDYFIIRNINFVEPRNKVSIFNRWGDKVFEVENYDNSSRRFNGFGNGGNQLSSGVYFYKIEFISGRETISGFLSLKK